MLFLNKMLPSLDELPSEEREQLIYEARLAVFKRHTGTLVLLFSIAIVLPFLLWIILFASILGSGTEGKLLWVILLAGFTAGSVTFNSWLRARLVVRYLNAALSSTLSD
jgi:hypothetical protein